MKAPSYRPPGQPGACGTDAGYRRHLLAGETRCDPCLAAHARTVRRWAQQRRREHLAWQAARTARQKVAS